MKENILCAVYNLIILGGTAYLVNSGWSPGTFIFALFLLISPGRKENDVCNCRD
jgi:hypothetical protein